MIKKSISGVVHNQKKVLAFSGLLLLVVMVAYSLMSVGVFANGVRDTVDSETAMKNLQGYVHSDISSITYEKDGGGFYSGNELLVPSGNGYDLDESKFQELSKKSQSQLVSDMAQSSTNAVAKHNGKKVSSVDPKAEKAPTEAVTGVTDEVAQTWWGNLQKKDGVGTKFLSTVLQDTKPDFVTAQRWYKPFSGPIGTLLAFGSIIAMALIGLVMVADILYITIPPVRLFVDDQGADDKMITSKIFSHAAIHAVKTVEEGGDKANKHALGIYFKSRVVELVILGICLLYLVNGRVYSFVGYILDLLSGIV